MWWHDLRRELWNGLTAWVVLLVHVGGGWEQFPLYDAVRGGDWCDVGFLVGAGAPVLGTAGAGACSRTAAPVDSTGHPHGHRQVA
jgi:hypothetical protein